MGWKLDASLLVILTKLRAAVQTWSSSGPWMICLNEITLVIVSVVQFKGKKDSERGEAKTDSVQQ